MLLCHIILFPGNVKIHIVELKNGSRFVVGYECSSVFGSFEGWENIIFFLHILSLKTKGSIMGHKKREYHLGQEQT